MSGATIDIGPSGVTVNGQPVSLAAAVRMLGGPAVAGRTHFVDPDQDLDALVDWDRGSEPGTGKA
jgi:hypothetical protein